MANRKKAVPQQRRRWTPLKPAEMNPAFRQALIDAGEDDVDRITVWSNDVYEVIVRPFALIENGTGVRDEGWLWLGVKSFDRRPIRDWRHLQQIKNEVAGPECEAVELFPAESRLVDSANEFHLFVMPEGSRFPFGYSYRSVLSHEEVEHFNKERRAQGVPSKARQRPWQPGLTTGQEGSE